MICNAHLRLLQQQLVSLFLKVFLQSQERFLTSNDSVTVSQIFKKIYYSCDLRNKFETYFDGSKKVHGSFHDHHVFLRLGVHFARKQIVIEMERKTKIKVGVIL